MKRLGYINKGLTEEGKRRLDEAVRLRVCPYHWVPLPPRKQVWCGKRTMYASTCYWAFHMDPRWGGIKDWQITRAQALARDGRKCVLCGAEATEVDHIVEIQDGGPEFDLANLRSLCHACHVAKTNAQRHQRSSRVAEPALRKRIKLEAFA